jgi:hypothetical protein
VNVQPFWLTRSTAGEKLVAMLLLRRLAVVACVAGAACSRQKPVVTPSPFSPFTFVAETEGDSVLEGRFEGTATASGSWLTVVVPRGLVTVPPGEAATWRNLTVRAYLATDFKRGEWKAVAQSRPVNVFRFINFGQSNSGVRRTLPLEEPLTFMVPIPAGATAATSRLAIELEWTYAVGRYGETDTRIAFSGPLSMAPAR